MASNFSLLLDELVKLGKEREQEVLQKSLDQAADLRRKEAAAKVKQDQEVADMVTRSAALCKQLAAEAKAKKLRLAVEKKKAAEDVIAARNAERTTVSNVLAKALELNRLGQITAAEVARIEISAHSALQRIGR
ncbi:MAG: hypothetical protein WCJ64_14390 [Rhodospirillaceae bacterium]